MVERVSISRNLTVSGFDAIDAMHAEILWLCGTVRQAAEDQSVKFDAHIRALDRLVRDHFRQEEALLRRWVEEAHYEHRELEHGHLQKLLFDAAHALSGTQKHGASRRSLANLIERWLLLEITENDGPILHLARQHATG